MIVLLWIVAIILLIAGCVGIIVCWRDGIDIGTPVGSVLAVFFGVMLIFALAGLFETNPEPKPIDVYRGKTTLRITYQDSIPLDTVVVWKDEYKPVSKKK